MAIDLNRVAENFGKIRWDILIFVKWRYEDGNISIKMALWNGGEMQNLGRNSKKHANYGKKDETGGNILKITCDHG